MCSLCSVVLLLGTFENGHIFKKKHFGNILCSVLKSANEDIFFLFSLSTFPSSAYRNKIFLGYFMMESLCCSGWNSAVQVKLYMSACGRSPLPWHVLECQGSIEYGLFGNILTCLPWLLWSCILSPPGQVCQSRSLTSPLHWTRGGRFWNMLVTFWIVARVTS